MKLTLHLVLYVVALLLFLAAAAIVDGHINMGNPTVVADVALATVAAALVAKDGGR